MVSQKIEGLREKVQRGKTRFRAKKRARARKKRKSRERVRANEPETVREEARATARQTKLLANELGAQKLSEAVQERSEQVSEEAEVVSGKAGDVPLTEPAEEFATAAGGLFDTVQGVDQDDDGVIGPSEMILGKDFDGDGDLEQTEQFDTFGERPDERERGGAFAGLFGGGGAGAQRDRQREREQRSREEQFDRLFGPAERGGDESEPLRFF